MDVGIVGRERRTELPGRTQPPVPVLVVGAGPTGLMAAALLRRCGVAVRIIDRSPTAVKESRAFGVQARSLELFRTMGLAEEMLDRGQIASGAQIFVGGRHAAQLDFDEIGRRDTPYPFLLMVPQSEIEEVLAGDLARHGVEVERGVTLTGLRQDADEATAGILGPDGAAGEIRASFVLGADGAHSVVRKALGLAFEGAAYTQTFLLADCRVEWPLDHDHFKILAKGRALGLFLPLKGRRVSRVMASDPEPSSVADPSGARQGSSPVSLAEVEEAFRAAAGVEVRLSDATWLTRYRIHHRGVDRYRVGRAFVLGDAAHIHSPAGGQGMNTGLQDAANLSWKLALALGERGGSALLDSYHDERWPVGEEVLHRTDRIFSAVAAQSGWGTALRNTLLPVVAATVSRFGLARSRAFHFVSQLGIRYGESRFVVDGVSEGAGSAFRDGVRAGRRAPDAAVGRGRDVFDLIAGYRFHLLAFSRTPLGEPEIAALDRALAALRDEAPFELATAIVCHSLIGRDPRLHRAESGEAFAAYGLDSETPQALFLIRPDAYVAWRADGLDVEACRAFLSGCGLASAPA